MSHLPCQVMPCRKALSHIWQSLSQGISGYEVGNAIMAYDRMRCGIADVDPFCAASRGKASDLR